MFIIRSIFFTAFTHDECNSFQLIDGKGKFNGVGLDNFLDEVKLSESGVSYVVVSIIGPQSSGKSTLLNHLFNTTFKEMNAATGKSQTTQGIWMANCVGIKPHTLVMDVEGNDGRERGEDDTKFERQSALFSLVASNIVILNMWHSDVGRDQGANKPLLRMVFQAMVTTFSTNKVTLMFVVRDKSPETPFAVLEQDLKKDVEKIWKPIAPGNAPLSDFFNVEVVALSHYKYERDQFKEDVSYLRKRFFNSLSPGGLAGNKKCLIPASGFSYSTKSLWETIKDNSHLDIPSHKVMVATVLCDKIADERFAWFSENEAWHKVQKSVQDGHIKGFQYKINSLLDTCLVEYHETAKLYDDNVRKRRQTILIASLLQLIEPVWNLVVSHIGAKSLQKFKDEFDKAVQNGEDLSKAVRACTDTLHIRFDKRCADAAIKLAKWDISTAKATLLSHVVDHVTFVTKKIAQREAEREAAELRLQHEMETKAAIRKAAELEAAYESRVSQLKAEQNAIDQERKHQMALAKLKEENDAAEAKRKHDSELAKHNDEVAKLKKERDSVETRGRGVLARIIYGGWS